MLTKLPKPILRGTPLCIKINECGLRWGDFYIEFAHYIVDFKEMPRAGVDSAFSRSGIRATPTPALRPLAGRLALDYVVSYNIYRRAWVRDVNRVGWGACRSPETRRTQKGELAIATGPHERGDELGLYELIGHNWNCISALLNWLTVRHCPTRRIYGAADAGLSISNATYPPRTPAEKGGGFMQLRWFHIRSSIRGTCVIRANCSGSLRGPTCHVGYPVTWRLLVSMKRFQTMAMPGILIGASGLTRDPKRLNAQPANALSVDRTPQTSADGIDPLYTLTGGSPENSGCCTPALVEARPRSQIY